EESSKQSSQIRERKLMLKITKSSYFMPQTEWILEPGEYIVGRYPSNDIVLPDPFISRRHARVFYRDGEWFIEDLDSTNGTIVNNENIKGKGPRRISDGDEIIIGLTVIVSKIL
ncbi:MAG: FHA domain-containing protein, partial [Desulfurococcaceae archaeon]